MVLVFHMFYMKYLSTNLPSSEKFLVSPLNTEFYICFHNNSNNFAQASAYGVIDITNVLNYSSFVAIGGTERISASPSTTHLTYLGCS